MAYRKEDIMAEKGAKILVIDKKKKRCSICSHKFTSTHIEALPGVSIYVCESCLDASNYYFIW